MPGFKATNATSTSRTKDVCSESARIRRQFGFCVTTFIEDEPGTKARTGSNRLFRAAESFCGLDHLIIPEDRQVLHSSTTTIEVRILEKTRELCQAHPSDHGDFPGGASKYRRFHGRAKRPVTIRGAHGERESLITSNPGCDPQSRRNCR